MTEQDFKQFITVKQGLTGNSIKLYILRFRVFHRWLLENNETLTKESCERFIYSLRLKGLKNSSVNTYIHLFAHLYHYYKDRGIEHTFLQGFRSMPKVQAVVEILTPNEIERILAIKLEYKPFRGRDVSFLDEMYSTLWTFCAYTGCRFDEAASLQIKHCNLEARHVLFTETKNKTTRRVALSEPLLTRLKLLVIHRSPTDLVFCNSMGNKVTAQEAQKDLHERARIAGIYPQKRVYPHLFRHSLATELLKSGVDVTMVASILGHKDIQTTYQNYVHLADETLRKALAAHPLIRKHTEPSEVLRIIKSAIQSLAIDRDERFDFTLTESPENLSFKVKVKKAI